MKKICTLCIAYKHPNVLLGLKKRGFGEGRWNGFGGKVKEGESIEEAASRELFEEAGISNATLALAGVLEFSWENKHDVLEVHVFNIQDFSGSPKESEEMKPQWFHVNEIPFQDMWQDDAHWFPLFLAGKMFSGHFHFDEHDNIVRHELSENNL